MIDTSMEKEKRFALRKKLTNLFIKTPLEALSKVWHFYADNMVLSSVNMGSTSLYPSHPFRRKTIYKTKAGILKGGMFIKAAGRIKMGERCVVAAPYETDRTTGQLTIRGCPRAHLWGQPPLSTKVLATLEERKHPNPGCDHGQASKDELQQNCQKASKLRFRPILETIDDERPCAFK